MTIFSWAADAWWDDSEVMVPLLKFIADFVSNRGGSRIHFVESSANGIRLFKEASGVVLKYGNRCDHQSLCRNISFIMLYALFMLLSGSSLL